jgi:ubiquinone/menaquinone biosynthesis C-methylase UbiE
MGLLDLADVAPLLACPRCRSHVVEAAEGFGCSSDSCALSAPGSFPVTGGWPTLVDFEHSIFEPAELLGPSIEAAPGLGRWSIGRLPPRLRSWWKPRNQVAARNVETLLGLLRLPAPLILVIGGGTIGSGVEAIYADRRARIVAFDIYKTPLVQFLADAHQIPLADASVDAVLVQAVLEHVLDPGQVVEEIHRVLRPDGLVYAETPFMQQVHAGAYDFTRYTSSGHRYLFRAFEEIAAGPVAGPGTQMLWSVDHAVRGLVRSELAGKLARLAFFWLRYLDRLVPTSFAMDNATAYFFLGRRSERQLSPREIAGYYRGAQRSAPRSFAAPG